MSAANWAFDGLLALGLLWFAWRALTSPSLFRGVVLLIAYGLLMSLVWARLGAVDIALAEAAIGAGVTGALLLDVVGRIAERPAPEGRAEDRPAGGWGARAAVSGLVAVLAGGLIWALAALPEDYPGLKATVMDELDASGVGNPVTAVLLNFRAYDTLLEVGVLLLAVLGMMLMRGDQLAHGDVIRLETERAVHTAMVRALVPVMVVVAGYLLWAGTSTHAGAFQAGAILGAAGILMIFGRVLHDAASDRLGARVAVVLGYAAFFVLGVALMPVTGFLFTYPEGWAYTLIFLVEALLMVSIGAALALFYGISARTPAQDGR